MAVASRSGAVGVRRARRGARRARPSPLCLPPDGVKRLRYSAALQSPSPLGPSVARLRPGPVCAPLAVVVVAWFRPPPPCSAFRAPGVGPPRGVGARGPGGRPGVVVWPRVPGRPAAALGLSAASPLGGAWPGGCGGLVPGPGPAQGGHENAPGRGVPPLRRRGTRGSAGVLIAAQRLAAASPPAPRAASRLRGAGEKPGLGP